MNNSRITPEDLTDLVCGELDQAQAAHIQAAINADPELAAQADELRQALTAVAAPNVSQPTLSADFNRQLRLRLETEPAISVTPVTIPKTSVTPRRRINWPWFSLPAAAAAIVILAVLFGPFRGTLTGPSGGGGVAWAQVVQAINKVEQFHITAINNDPRSATRPKLFTIDLFYRAPNSWRAQGLGVVHFLNDKGVQMYIIPDGVTVEGQTVKFNPPQLIPQDFVEQFRTKGLWEGILAAIFNGKSPIGEPVKSDPGVGPASGVEVFDYAVDPKEMWVRIWVLKESKLPIRLNVNYPAGNESMLVVFDYSDPQPDGFFDFDKFNKEVKERNLREENQIFGVGMKPVADKRPRNAGQIFDLQGGFHAPAIREIQVDRTSNGRDTGDIVLVTDSPRNTPPSGINLIEARFTRVTDNWGNHYVEVTHTMGIREENPARWYFTPVPPFKTGVGAHKLTFEFMVHTSEQGSGALKWTTLASQTIDLPESAPPNTSIHVLIDPIRLAVMRYLRQVGTLAQQQAMIERWTQENAASPVRQVEMIDLWGQAWLEKKLDPMLDDWRVKLLREHGREEQAWALFEEKLLAPMLEKNPGNEMMGQYLLRLAASGKSAEFDKTAQRLQEARQKISPTLSKDERTQMEQYFTGNWSLLAQALRLPQFRQAAEKTPEVLEIVTSRDGRLAVHVRVPAPPADYRGDNMEGQDPSGWFYWMNPQGTTGWSLLQRRVDPVRREVWLAYSTGQQKVGTPTGPSKLTLGGRVMFMRDNLEGGHANNEIAKDWSVTVDIPQPQIEKIADWWQKSTGKPWQEWPNTTPPAPNQVDLWRSQALQESEQKHFDAAAELYRKALATPDEQWSIDSKWEVNGGIDMSRRMTRVDLVNALIQAGHMEDADKEIAELSKGVSAASKDEDLWDFRRRQRLLSAQFSLIKRLISDQRFSEAGHRLDAMEKDRPNLEEIPDGQRPWKTAQSNGSWWPRTEEHNLWAAFDTLRWDLQDAQAKRPQP